MAYTINNDETELTINGKIYVAIDGEECTCEDCSINKLIGWICNVPCNPNEREDGKDVIWKLKDTEQMETTEMKTTQMETTEITPIPTELYRNLVYLGIIDPSGVRNTNVGKSNYSTKTIQAWSVWLDYPELTSWDHDIIKRVLRTKEETGMTADEARLLDYEKIKHDCEERIRQLNYKSNE